MNPFEASNTVADGIVECNLSVNSLKDDFNSYERAHCSELIPFLDLLLLQCPVSGFEVLQGKLSLSMVA